MRCAKSSPGLEFVHAEELDRDVIEGPGHTGFRAVVQVIARKPMDSGEIFG